MVISDFKASHGRQLRWQIRTRSATDTIPQCWVGASWIIGLGSTGRRDGVQVLALVRTLSLNLLRGNGFRSIRAGLIAGAHDISRMLAWAGVSPDQHSETTFSQPWVRSRLPKSGHERNRSL